MPRWCSTSPIKFIIIINSGKTCTSLVWAKVFKRGCQPGSHGGGGGARAWVAKNFNYSRRAPGRDRQRTRCISNKPPSRPPAFITSSERRGLCALEGLKVLRYQPTHMPCLSRERAGKTRALQNRRTKATELDLLFTAAGRIFIWKRKKPLSCSFCLTISSAPA